MISIIVTGNTGFIFKVNECQFKHIFTE